MAQPRHRPPLTRAWHVHAQDGTGHTIAAHTCRVSGGALSFGNLPPGERRPVLVRAFAPHRWIDCELTDTPAAAAVHLQPPSVETGRAR